ncbi:YceG family protein [Clostridium sp. MCC353]|uniref:YceG family protein n=1 Tax=Clostridium sp. MCC353 TaxID=2592646 RepID=UPI0031FE4917
MMFEHRKIQKLDDYFTDLNARREQGVYFYRINAYNDAIKTFIQNYYEAARLSGVVIEGKIPNPDEKNLSYYSEIMGMDFQMSVGFIGASLKKWLPRLNEYQRTTVAASIYDTLETMRREGKNDNMLKNAYIKFMCWMYYKFERILSRLGQDKIPKILYEGDISNYELKLITILSGAGCDVLLLQYHGDGSYLKLDPESKLSDSLVLPDMTSFPKEFNIGWLRQEMEKRIKTERLYGTKPQVLNCTNAWITGKGFQDITAVILTRGQDSRFFYNCYCRINGVEDKLTYLNELYQMRLEIKNSKRNVVVVENEIPQPTMDEIASIVRKTYKNIEQMLIDLSNNIKYYKNIELERLLKKAFIDIILEKSEAENMMLNKLVNKAVYLLCWLRRYQSELFPDWKMPDISCFIYLGGCRDDNEAMFLKLLSKLPTDVLILNPNLNTKCCLNDEKLYEINYSDSLAVDRFPMENSDIRMGTAAYYAERELDTLMYGDSGMYRNQQYTRAMSVTLQTMYEEIAILWKQELKYRPNFSVVDGIVSLPVIFSKISGVKDGNLAQYWAGIKALKTEDVFVVKKVPFISPTDPNPVKPYVTEFYKNGRLQKNRIKSHKSYQYGYLRENIQDYILDKLQLLIDQKVIKGTFENGTEYTVISTVLNLNKDILRLIQKFDFTKKNPKLIYINCTERVISLEDSIMVMFLNLIGFDLVFYVPTGYQSVENFFNKRVMEEHQIGDYVYDLQVPDLDAVPTNTHLSWREKIFKRGN